MVYHTKQFSADTKNCAVEGCMLWPHRHPSALLSRDPRKPQDSCESRIKYNQALCICI